MAAARNFFDMKDVSDTPKQDEFLRNLDTATNDEKKKYLSLCTRALITKFALHHVQSLDDESATCTDVVFDYACSIIGFGLVWFPDPSRMGGARERREGSGE